MTDRAVIKSVLDPMERLSEILFGLIMVLTFTCSFSVVGAGRAEVRHMLIGALSCNVAWGIIDSVFYLMASLSERGHNLLVLNQVRESTDARSARRLISDAMPPLLASLLPDSQVELLRQKLLELPNVPERPRLTKEDWQVAARVFMLVFLSTVPVALPFIFIPKLRLALRISNGVAILLLFTAGYMYGKYVGYRPWRFAVGMVLVGVAMVGVAVALGG